MENSKLISVATIEEDGKYALIDRENNNRLTDFHKHIYLNVGFPAGQSEYYLVEDDIDDVPMMAVGQINKGIVTDYYNYISDYGLLRGESPYFVSQTLNNLTASRQIHDMQGHRISFTFQDIVDKNGFVRNMSPYFIGTLNKKQGLFIGNEVFSPNPTPVGGWFSEIYDFSPILYGESNIVLTRNNGIANIMQLQNKTLRNATNDSYTDIYAVIINKQTQQMEMAVVSGPNIVALIDKNGKIIRYLEEDNQGYLVKVVELIHKYQVYEYAYKNKEFGFYANTFITFWLTGKND